MKIIGKENIIAEVNKIAEKLDGDDKSTLQELIFYYTCDQRDTVLLTSALTRSMDSHQKLLHKTMHEAFIKEANE